MPRWAKGFLAVYRQTANVTAAAKAVGVVRKTVYACRDRNPAFRELMDDAKEEAADLLELEALRRGMHGVEEPVFYKGKKVGTIKRYSDRMLDRMLKAARPEKYRDHVDVNARVEKIPPVDLEAAQAMTPQEVAQAYFDRIRQPSRN